MNIITQCNNWRHKDNVTKVRCYACFNYNSFSYCAYFSHFLYTEAYFQIYYINGY